MQREQPTEKNWVCGGLQLKAGSEVPFPLHEVSITHPHLQTQKSSSKALMIGTGIAAALGTGIGGISTSAHFYYKLSQELKENMEQVVESFVAVQRQINSLASVALQNRRALDLLTTEKGRICLFLGEGYCSFVNETGIVQGRVRELRDRIKGHKKELQKLSTPEACSNWPALGCSLSWNH